MSRRVSSAAREKCRSASSSETAFAKKAPLHRVDSRQGCFGRVVHCRCAVLHKRKGLRFVNLHKFRDAVEAPNIHHRKWLTCSNRNSLEGHELCAVCKELGLTQLVHEPTRGDHLLDLVLSSFSGVKAGVLPLIADHKPVTATLKLSVPSQVEAGRKVWRHGQADWERLHDSLADACWDHIADQSTTAAAKWITGTKLRSASSCIPLSTLRTKKSSHPWWNHRSIALVDAKRTAERTPFEKEATLACSAGLAAAYHDYTARTAQKMRCIKPSSKLWWKKAKEVMKHEAQVSSFPALKSNDDAWVLDAQGKANLFAVTFAGKCKRHRLHPMP